MDKENKILINIIGTGYDVCVGEVSFELSALLSKAEAQKKQPLHHLLFDEDFYKKNPISKADNSGPYSSWKDFNDKAIYRGANLSEPGQLEIWINRRRIKSCKFHELISNLTLFPLFDIQEQMLSPTLYNKPHLLIGVQEKGHLAKLNIKSGKFIPEELQLHTIQFMSSKSTIKLLHKITYSGIALKSSKCDTVVTGTVLTRM